MQTNTLNGVEEDALTCVLLQKSLLTIDDLVKIKKQADNFGQTVFQYLLQYRFISSENFLNACTEFFQIPEIKLDNKKNNDFLCCEIPFNLIKNNSMLPIEKNNNQLTIAISNPNDIGLAKKLSFQTGLTIRLTFARYDILCRFHNALVCEKQYQALDDKNEHLAQSITHQLLSDAIHRNASDIHIEPYQQNLRVRFRVDGLLHEIIKLPDSLTDAIISCIKVLSHLDIAIKRTPQDGRLAFRSYLGFFKDCRVSTCPTLFGEKIVIRLLDANTQIRSINTLGLNSSDQKIILDSIKKPQGLILVTGPTGSGKTITLYTLLNLLNQTHRNISTIEDPVEMQIEGINQTHINTKTGLTFSQSLRALLRQDPDVIMIGEIRDQETAEMAIRAAQTGHLVLSTLHTNSAPEAITRLSHMGIAPFHLSSALTLVIAQRLVRKLCPLCKTHRQFPENILINLEIENSTTLFQEKGCTHCADGFQGRIGIFELMPITTTLNESILDSVSHTSIAEKNRSSGHLNLWQSAIEAVKKGTTSLNEIYRVIPT